MKHGNTLRTCSGQTGLWISSSKLIFAGKIINDMIDAAVMVISVLIWKRGDGWLYPISLALLKKVMRPWSR
ncbi:hypothetical protein ACFLTQ_00550 [Chloroflexota bacterium]